MINWQALEAARAYDAPFRFITAEGVLSATDAREVRSDYPAIETTGYHPLSKLAASGAFADLMAELQSLRLAEILSEKLDLDLVGKPRMITIRKLSKRTDGRIHNDSVSKICTMLIYLNDVWDAEAGGAVRVLNGPDKMDDFALEMPPLAGHVFAFKRSDTSWHGHPPFEGVRFVIQVTFLTSQAALDRKEKRSGLQYILKLLNPFE